MALKLDEIRALAERVAASHGLDVVDLEYLGGGGKHRTLRVFIEKNSEGRAALRERIEARRKALPGAAEGDGDAPGLNAEDAEDEGDEDSELDGLPAVENLELLSGISHGDCEQFSRDFGTVLDVEELVPGTEYLLEVSSPGLDRKLAGEGDFRRFTGSLLKLQTFEAVAGNRHWQGRIASVDTDGLHLLLPPKPKGRKAKASAGEAGEQIVIPLGQIEKAQLVPEF